MEYIVFPFLSLPGELRNKIYKVLLKNRSQIPSGAYVQTHGREIKLSICAAILRVSKQIYHEALPLLYTLNRFNAHPSMLRTFPYLADPYHPVKSDACSSLITRFCIAVRLDNDPRWDGEKLAKAFNGAQELEVEAWQSAYGITDIANLMPFSHVRGVGKAKVHGCGISRKFSHWLENAMQSPVGTIVPDWGASDWDTWTDGDK